MRVTPTKFSEILLVEPVTYEDPRGYFRETWSAARYAEHGIGEKFVQDNLSFSTEGVLRGLHLQNPNAQSKLVSVSQGEIFDVAVDVRVGSPTFGEWAGVTLSASSGTQLYIPKGFAHGFCAIGGDAVVTYKVDAAYDPQSEITVRWDDSAIGIEWPATSLRLSDKDRAGMYLKDIPRDRLPSYGGHS